MREMKDLDQALAFFHEYLAEKDEDLIGKGIIYKKYSDMKDYLFIAENQMISKHIPRLVKKRKIAKIGKKLLLN